MSNYHLRDTSLSLKAKGLLSLMLSLPDTWDYTTKGLSTICKDGIDSICATVKELECAGYIIRRRIRNNKGQLTDTEYTILEEPKRENPVLDNPVLEKPEQVSPILEKPKQENPMQLNKEILNTKISNTDQSIYQTEETINHIFNEKMDGIDIYRNIIKENIGYEILTLQYNKNQPNQIMELILEIICSTKKTIRIGSESIPAAIVKERFMKLNQFHIEYVFECLEKNDTKIHNIRSYLLTALYNAKNTIDHYYQSQIASSGY